MGSCHLQFNEFMGNPIAKRMISVLVLLLLVSSTLGISYVPFIIAHKKVSLSRLKSGLECVSVSVSIDIYNQGASTAYDVSLSDASWPQDAFEVVSGNTSRTWERLDGGGLLSHSFELETNCRSHIQPLFCLWMFLLIDLPNRSLIRPRYELFFFSRSRNFS